MRGEECPQQSQQYVGCQDCMRVLGAVSRVDNWGDERGGWGSREKPDAEGHGGGAQATRRSLEHPEPQDSVECSARPGGMQARWGPPGPLVTCGPSGTVFHLPDFHLLH